MATNPQRAIRPLATATFGLSVLFAGAILTVLALAIGAGQGSFGGFGNSPICATNPNSGVSGFSTRGLGIVTKPGAQLDLSAPIGACAAHPSLGQRILDTLTSLPTSLIWVGVLVLLWRLIQIASRRGPFTVAAAGAMRLLGWFILVGGVLATALEGFAKDQLLTTMIVQQNYVGDAFSAPLKALPVLALAGAGLLTFARITRLAAVMDDELKGTV